jgi:hypothetical protein
MFSVKRPTPAGVLLFARVWLHVPVAGSVGVCVCFVALAPKKRVFARSLGACSSTFVPGHRPMLRRRTHLRTRRRVYARLQRTAL